MKITKSQLKQIIKEEIKVVAERTTEMNGYKWERTAQGPDGSSGVVLGPDGEQVAEYGYELDEDEFYVTMTAGDLKGYRFSTWNQYEALEKVIEMMTLKEAYSPKAQSVMVSGAAKELGRALSGQRPAAMAVAKALGDNNYPDAAKELMSAYEQKDIDDGFVGEPT